MRLAFPLVLALFSSAVQAAVLTVPELPPSAFADTEVSTNVAFVAMGPGDRLFSLSLVLDAAASNAVEVAFGRDTNGNGELEVFESEFALGWSAGAWFLEDWRAEVSDRTGMPYGERRLDWSVRLTERGEAWQARAQDGGQPVLAEATAACRPTYYGADWDLVRVTTRGVTDPAGRVELRTSSVGLEVRVR